MTRKDYIAIAAAFRGAHTSLANHLFLLPSSAFAGWQVAADHVADALAKDNPRFDRERFLTACRQEEKTKTPIVYALCHVGGFKAWGNVRYSSRESAQMVANAHNDETKVGPFLWVSPWDPILNVALKETK